MVIILVFGDSLKNCDNMSIRLDAILALDRQVNRTVNRILGSACIAWCV